MITYSPDTASSLYTAVGVASAHFGASMGTSGDKWVFVSNTNCWIKQGAGNPTAVAAAAANMYVPANVPVLIDGRNGVNLAVIRDSIDGRASLTRVY